MICCSGAVSCRTRPANINHCAVPYRSHTASITASSNSCRSCNWDLNYEYRPMCENYKKKVLRIFLSRKVDNSEGANAEPSIITFNVSSCNCYDCYQLSLHPGVVACPREEHTAAIFVSVVLTRNAKSLKHGRYRILAGILYCYDGVTEFIVVVSRGYGLIMELARTSQKEMASSINSARYAYASSSTGSSSGSTTKRTTAVYRNNASKHPLGRYLVGSNLLAPLGDTRKQKKHTHLLHAHSNSFG